MVQKVGNLVTKQPELEPTLQLLFSQVYIPYSMLMYSTTLLSSLHRQTSLLLPLPALVAVALCSPLQGVPPVTSAQGTCNMRELSLSAFSVKKGVVSGVIVLCCIALFVVLYVVRSS